MPTDALSAARRFPALDLRTGARIALALAAAAFAYGLARLAHHARLILPYPYDLDYGEGVVWHQMAEMVAGRGFAALQTYPAVVFEYPPLYHWIVAAVAASGTDPLFAGRAVSLAAALAAAALTGGLAFAALAGEERRIRMAAGLVAALAFATTPVVLSWSLLMRVDTLAVALMLAGMLLTLAALRRPGAAVLAGIAFAAALYAKQTSLPAPAAAFLTLVLIRPRIAWVMAGFAIVAGSVAAVALSVASDGQFFVHIIQYNINRMIWAHGWKLLAVLAAATPLIALGASGAAMLWHRHRLADWRTLPARMRADPARIAAVMLLLWLLLKTLMLPAILKWGASDNYLLDWFAPLAVLTGVASAPILRAAFAGGERPPAVLAALLGLGLPLQIAGVGLTPQLPSSADRNALARLVERIAASDKPVISEDMVLMLRAGKPVTWEPAIAAELGKAGLYDDRAFAENVRRGGFAFVVSRGDRGDPAYDDLFNPPIADAIAAAYPRRERAGYLTVHLPR